MRCPEPLNMMRPQPPAHDLGHSTGGAAGLGGGQLRPGFQAEQVLVELSLGPVKALGASRRGWSYSLGHGIEGPSGGGAWLALALSPSITQVHRCSSLSWDVLVSAVGFNLTGQPLVSKAAPTSLFISIYLHSQQLFKVIKKCCIFKANLFC